MNKNPQIISITGMGIISPSGKGIESLWKACLQKQSLIQNGLGTIPENILSTKDGKSLAMATYAITQAVNEANWGKFTQDDVIIIGTTTGQISLWENELISYSTGVTPTADAKISLRKQPLSSLSEDLKKTLNFPGRIIILASACSASTQAIILANDMLISGRAKRCLAGGVEELGKLTINGFGSLKLLNQDACKPFDQNRMGINLSEGAAFYSFEINSQKPALAHILGGSTVLDSYHMTSPNPDGEGLQKAIITTLKKSQLKAEEISFVHAHGTGSSHNDQAESAALSKLFPHRPFVVSTKGVHGHALGASGSLELGICLQALNLNTIPPVTGLDTIDENISLNLPKSVQDTRIQYLLKTTLGFGGVNSAFILRRPIMLKLVAFAKKNFSDIEVDLNDDKNRKKSHNMLLASRTVEDLLNQMKKIPGLAETELDLIFCSGEGEIEQTFEFYKNLAQNRARPILFQNSLHNSTLGSLSLEVPRIASGITVSSGDLSFETAIDVALSSGSTNPILILGVDACNKELAELRTETYQNQVEFIEGGCGGLFVPDSHPLFHSLQGPVIEDIKFETTEKAQKFSNYYPSNGLEAIYEQLNRSPAKFSLLRPKGHQVTITVYEH